VTDINLWNAAQIMTALANESRYNATREEHIADVLNMVAWAFWGPVVDANDVPSKVQKKAVDDLTAITVKAAADMDAVLSKVTNNKVAV
jgi:hypothetical protein